MKYQILHRSVYAYAEPVEGGLHVAVARPRSFRSFWRTQACHTHALEVRPRPQVCRETLDAFGNHQSRFEVHRPHHELGVTASSLVEVACGGGPGGAADPAVLDRSAPWEAVVAGARARLDAAGQAVLEQSLETALTPSAPALRGYARESFTPGRPVAAATLELARRIFEDFAYDPAATDLSTPVLRVFEQRRGVCQDFAHLALAMLRGLGLPARYVSGYVRTGNDDTPVPPGGVTPPPDSGLVGSDASHAWVSVRLGEEEPGVDPSAAGWFDVDPTNAKLAGDEHVTLAWGRDYADVSPLKGVLVGGGSHSIRVSVSVRPVAADPAPG
ncbi:transglutaminase family protein [Phycisphaera mikurensis]|uniref:Transglutaminase-like domain-containing protein n=1 Tax=Phycisphaera mikurensis (strain NBRC 102666 / KCTC 22515 / FYK2301M01) TaxID=1142394 RepID=I0IHC6_PHYMF|nr:transglutaminase family protein [Phycisphaera mikurensis]MBB6440913.1 transglutaminase-like putative cysteine protease [Phycisphaera mikurensis]BAM04664.1 hypothetical protein PSMK_25050 [Phycisphaera mikurensis NBRC 102666]